MTLKASDIAVRNIKILAVIAMFGAFLVAFALVLSVM